MSKRDLVIDCACGMNCGRTMTVSEDEANKSLALMSVKFRESVMPEFFELNKETAEELVRYLRGKYKLT